jgi:hypothetical protein
VTKIQTCGLRVAVLEGCVKRSLLFVGLQVVPGAAPLDLWNPLDPVAHIPAGSTVTGNTLRKLGLFVPNAFSGGFKRGDVYKP